MKTESGMRKALKKRDVLKGYIKLNPIHCFSDVHTNRIKPVYLLQPNRNIAVHPPHDLNHLFMYLFYMPQIPTNGFMMEHAVSERAKTVQRS